MSLSRPSVRISVNGRSLSAAEAALLSLRLDLCINGAHDAVLLTLWPQSTLADSQVGDTLSIAIGEQGAEQDQLTGTIAAVRHGLRSVTLEGLGATAALSRSFVAQTYLNQSVGQIVQDLAGSASVSVDQVQADLQLGVWHVDSSRPVWSHLQQLAKLSGTDLGASASGGLRFVPADAASSPTQLRYGAELLDWELARAEAQEPPQVAALGAGSEAGTEKSHWLRHDPGAGSRSRIQAGLVTKDAADAAAKALKDAASRAALRGRVWIVGNATLRPGDTVELADLPGQSPGTLRVLALQHRLDTPSGFVTRLSVEGAGGGGAGGLGGLP
jgi:prophage tail gpP-like protein